MLNKAYQEELRLRNKKLLQENMVAAILGDAKAKIPPLRDIRRERRPFKPSSVAPDILGKPRTTTKLPAIKQIEKRLAANVVADLQDAETGESINYTGDYWTGKEGRIDLNPKTILAMGTGKLDIHKTHQQPTSATTAGTPSRTTELLHSQSSPAISQEALSVHYGDTRDARHPLFEELMKKGPLVDRQHKWWSSRSDRIEVPDGEHLSDSDGGDDHDDDSYDTDDASGGSVGRVGSLMGRGEGGAFGAVAAAVSIGSLAEGSEDGDVAAAAADGQVVSFVLGGAGRGSAAAGTARSGTGTGRSVLKSPTKTGGGRRRSSMSSNGTGRRSTSRSALGSARQRYAMSPSYAAFLTNRSVASSANHDNDPRRLPKIDPTNKESWRALEERFYLELMRRAIEVDNIHRRINGLPLQPDNIEVSLKCREMARLKTKQMREAAAATLYEKERDRKAARGEPDNMSSSLSRCSSRGKQKEKDLERIRHERRIYLRTLQYNNEVLLIRKMSERGLLW